MNLSKLRPDIVLGMPLQMGRRLHYDLNRGKLDETSCAFVSSRGIAKGCHAVVDLGAGYSQNIESGKIAEMEAGTAIYLYTSSIKKFVSKYLRELHEPFVLVTGADDTSVSAEALGAGTVEALLESGLVTHWFAQNAEIQHPKLTLIPIGMDYHTLAGNHRRPWREFESPRDQERELLAVRARAPAVADRECAAYSNWHFALGRGDRQECFDRVDHGCVHFEPVTVPRRQSWTNNARHFFTISPLGNGLDCHRTWEALLLGTVPIVHTSPLDPLYEGLPVCIVEDWRQVTPDFLASQRKAMLERRYDFSKLYLSYWRDLISLRGEPAAKAARLEEFATFPASE